MRRIIEKYVGRGDPANDDAVDRYLTMMHSEVRMLFKVTPHRWRAVDLSELGAARDDE